MVLFSHNVELGPGTNISHPIDLKMKILFKRRRREMLVWLYCEKREISFI